MEKKESWWTGPSPIYGECPGVQKNGSIRSLPQIRLDECSRSQLLDYFNNSWALTEVLFSGLSCSEAFYQVPYHRLRHPLIFYYAHPATLYVNKLRVAGLIHSPVNDYFEKIFEVGVDEMSWDDMSKNEMIWPKLKEVTDYRREVYGLLKNLIETHPVFDPKNFPITPKSPGWALVMGFEHERIHLETSSVLIRELPLHFVKRPAQWPSIPPATETRESNSFFHVNESLVEFGKQEDFPSFGWDNEYGLQKEKVDAFSTTRFLISNSEFLAFVSDGGYRESRHWTEVGWQWRQFRNTKHPTFWIPEGPQGLHQYKLRTIFEEVDFRGEWPAIVNFHEAQAYCAWRTEKDKPSTPYRLLTEGEQHSLRQQIDPQDKWNLNLMAGSETPVHAHQSSKSGLGDVFGNVWQWSSDCFHPLPGFSVHPYYEDFSTPCFDGKHQMIFGGSFASTGDEASPFARFHFRPHFFQHAGFRMARSLVADVSLLESKAPVDRLLPYKNNFSQGMGLVHLNNAGLAPISAPARNAIQEWSDRFHKEGMHCNDDYLEAVEHARATLGRFLNCQASEIAFFQSTAGAVSQVAFGLELKPNDEVLMWDQEYGSNLYPWKVAAERAGASIRLVPSGPELATPVEKLLSAISERTRVIAVSTVQFQTGAITDILRLTKEARARNIWVVIDAIQSLGLFPFDFLQLGVDALCGGSHKWLTSPIGVGFLAIRAERIRELKPLMVGVNTFGSCDDPMSLTCSPKLDAKKFEAGSKQVLEILALAASLELIQKTGVDVLLAETKRLADRLRQGLIALEYRIHSPQESVMSGGIVSFQDRPGDEKKLVKNRISFARRGPGIRLSPHAFNTNADIDFTLNVLRQGGML